MGKFRHRLKGKAVKKIIKGQSASLNAETTKYRKAAQSGLFTNSNDNAVLSSDGIQIHNALSGNKSPSISNDVQSISEEGSSNATSFVSYKSFASDWSECSNTSFSRLLEGFRTDSALHKKMLAILAAITEVIKNENGKESNTEYFAVLMTILESMDSEESISAALSLLAMNIRTIPTNVLKVKFNELSKTFIEILAKYVESENNVILKSIIGCTTIILRNQDPSAWSNSSTFDLLNPLLTLSTHSKPKIRKTAQMGVAAILRMSRFLTDAELGWDNKKPHPAASHVAKYCTAQILLNSSSGKNAPTSTLHLLSMLTNIIGTFPHPELKVCCETILRLMTLASVLLTSCCLQVLYALFKSRPQSWCLTLSLNGQILTALYDYQPPQNDVQPTLAWLTVMTEGHLNLAKLNRKACISILPRLFSVFSQLWLSERSEVMTSSSCSLSNLISECLSNIEDGLEPSEIESYVSKIITDLKKCLGFQYHVAWTHVLHVHSSIFQHCGQIWSELLTPTLRALAELRDSHKFPYPNELERAVMAAVKSMGPETVLQHIPLNLSSNTNTYEFERSWMIPVLKLSISNSRLQYFHDYFLPLAKLCKNKSEEASAKQDRVATYSYGLLHLQIWSLLPSFCNQPTDISNLKKIGPTLQEILKDQEDPRKDHKDLRMNVLTALRRLLDQSSDDANIAREMGRFAKNFLPTLFILYSKKRPVGSDEEAIHLATFETIKLYLQVTPSDEIDKLYIKTLEKLPDPGNEKAISKTNDKNQQEEIYRRTCILDILSVLVVHQRTRETIMSAYEKAAKPGVALKGRHLHPVQKKCYRLLEAILDHPQLKDDKEFHHEVFQNLIELVEVVAPRSKGARLSCLKILVNHENCREESFLKQLIPEVILACKDVNEKCRTIAYQMIVDIGHTFRLLNPDKPFDESIRDYLALVLAGLAGPANICSATILALAKITEDMLSIIHEDLINLILENICLLLTLPTREIVDGSLSYIRMYLKKFSIDIIGPKVSHIIQSLLGMTDDCKRHFRLKTRAIYLRFIRKFGYNFIANIIPESDQKLHKQLKNITKTESRKKRNKNANDDSDEDNDTCTFVSKPISKCIDEILDEVDDNESEMNEEEKLVSKKKKKGGTWIKEASEDIVDLMDPSVTKNISTTNPSVKAVEIEKKKTKTNPFKTASDGRLILRDLSDDDEADEKKGVYKKDKIDFDDESDLDEAETMTAITNGASRKRPRSTPSEASHTSSKYQPGGSGIHRSLKKLKLSSNAPISGSEYKTKKAFGDMKRKGKADPYAYVPLSRKSLNRRKQQKSATHLAKVVQGIKKGVKKGSKKGKKGVKKDVKKGVKKDVKKRVKKGVSRRN